MFKSKGQIVLELVNDGLTYKEAAQQARLIFTSAARHNPEVLGSGSAGKKFIDLDDFDRSLAENFIGKESLLPDDVKKELENQASILLSRKL